MKLSVEKKLSKRCQRQKRKRIHSADCFRDFLINPLTLFLSSKTLCLHLNDLDHISEGQSTRVVPDYQALTFSGIHARERFVNFNDGKRASEVLVWIHLLNFFSKSSHLVSPENSFTSVYQQQPAAKITKLFIFLLKMKFFFNSMVESTFIFGCFVGICEVLSCIYAIIP